MPPKSAAAAAPSPVAEFLVHCIRASKEKMAPDFKAVAFATGMSVGGAGNKYRDIMKKMEAEGAAWTKTEDGKAKKDTAALPKRKLTARSTLSKSAATAGSEDGGEVSDEAEEVPNKKRTTPIVSRRKVEMLKFDGDSEEVDVQEESSKASDDDHEPTPAKKIAKASAAKRKASPSPSTISEEDGKGGGNDKKNAPPKKKAKAAPRAKKPIAAATKKGVATKVKAGQGLNEAADGDNTITVVGKPGKGFKGKATEESDDDTTEAEVDVDA